MNDSFRDNDNNSDAMKLHALKKIGRFNDMIATIDNLYKYYCYLFKNSKRFVQQILVIQQVYLLLTMMMKQKAAISMEVMLILIKLVLKIRG